MSKHDEALKAGWVLFEAQGELSAAMTDLIRAQLDMERAMQGMTESQRAMVAADLVEGKGKGDDVVEVAVPGDDSTRH